MWFFFFLWLGFTVQWKSAVIKSTTKGSTASLNSATSLAFLCLESLGSASALSHTQSLTRGQPFAPFSVSGSCRLLCYNSKCQGLGQEGESVALFVTQLTCAYIYVFSNKPPKCPSLRLEKVNLRYTEVLHTGTKAKPFANSVNCCNSDHRKLYLPVRTRHGQPISQTQCCADVVTRRPKWSLH